jgi:hypothetical protein
VVGRSPNPANRYDAINREAAMLHVDGSSDRTRRSVGPGPSGPNVACAVDAAGGPGRQGDRRDPDSIRMTAASLASATVWPMADLSTVGLSEAQRTGELASDRYRQRRGVCAGRWVCPVHVHARH